MASVIEVSQLVKRFGNVKALNGLDLVVEQGQVHGFLGPNGAGKSTTIRILLGLLQSTGGTVKLLGADPWTDAVALHKRLAYVPGDVTLWPNLTGGEVIDLLAGLRGGINTAKRDQLLQRFELDPTKKARTYSKGNRQKVGLVAALASDVELYILDEPTSGLDPLMEAVFRDCVKELIADGKTILLSSHILAEVEALCDRVSIIRDGRTVESGSLTQLRHFARTMVTAQTERPVTGLNQIAGIHRLHIQDATISFEVDSKFLDVALEHLFQFKVLSLHSSPPTLEQLFLQHYQTESTTSESTTVGTPQAKTPQTQTVTAEDQQA